VNEERIRSPGAAFLLSQIGALSSRLWSARLAAIGLEPREVMLFRHVALAEGRSQQEVALAIGLPPSRIVALVDHLESEGWIERRVSAKDRRTRALHLTEAGRTVLEQVRAVSAEHEADLTRGLEPMDRDALIALLARVAAALGLVEGVHPGFADPNADQTRAGPDGPQPIAAATALGAVQLADE
jgi:DNA-binding MarR family transcriptional regulator